MTSTTSATSNKRWIKLPAIPLTKPNNHKTSKISKIVQSISLHRPFLEHSDQLEKTVKQGSCRHRGGGLPNCGNGRSLEKRTSECIVLELKAGTENQIKSEMGIKKSKWKPLFLV